MRKASLACLLFSSLALATAPARATDFTPWTRTAAIRFAGYNQTGTLTNFPALIVLSTNINGFNYADFRSGAHDDLRFAASDGTNDLNFEVESWDPNGLSYVWVRVPRLDDSNTVIRAYWGLTNQLPAPCTTNGSTWSEGFLSVWHLGETNTAAGSARADATGRHPGVTSNDVAKAASGAADGADELDAAAPEDFVYVPYHADFDLSSNYAISGWFRMANADRLDYRSLITKETGSSARNWWLSVTTNGYVWWKGGASLDCTSTVSYADNQWHQFSAVVDGSTARLYCDGVSRAVDTSIGTPQNPVTPVWIGRSVASNRFFKGGVDEMRIATVIRQPNWVWAEYSTMASNNTFTEYGTVLPQDRPLVANTAVSNITEASANACGYLTSTGAAPTTVLVYSGPLNGGTNAATWAATNVVEGAQPVGPLTVNIPLLSPNGTYFFRFCATNSYGISWAPSSFAFAVYTVNVTASDPTASEEGSDTGTFTVSRPLELTNDALTVDVAISGTATPGSDYSAPGTSVLIPAGSASVTVAVTPLSDMIAEPAESVVMSLLPGSYVVGTSNTATVTIASDEFSNWMRRARIRFSAYNRPETLTNIPLLVVLGPDVPGFGYHDLLSGPNADLRFSDASGTNVLPYEIDRWDTNGSSTVWVQVPRLADSNTCIWAYWGRNGMSVPPYTTNGATWSEGYAGVWHLTETNGTCFDSTANRNHGSPSNATLGAAGRIGLAASFGGSNQWIQVADSPSLNSMTNLTIESWVRDLADDTTARGIVSKRISAGTDPCYFLYKLTNLWFFVNKSSGGELVNTTTGSNVWRHLFATFEPGLSSDAEKVYIDGSFSAATSNAQPVVTNTTAPLYIGILNPAFMYGWSGQIDEVRVSRVARSTNWIWATWMNQASNTAFVTMEIASPAISNLDATAVTTGSATLNGLLVSTGQAPTLVSVYWGLTDGGTTPGAWATNVAFAGNANPGTLATNIVLGSSAAYGYRYCASNASGAFWASPSAYLYTGEVGIEAPDASASENGTDPATFSVFRPVSATGLPLRVAYTVSGTASNGVDYTALPAIVEFPAGATNVLVTVTPLPDTEYAESPETVTLTLAPGPYLIGAANAATATIANAQPSTVAAVSASGSDTNGDGSVASPFRSLTRALTNSPAYTFVYAAPGTYSTNSGEIFPLVIPGGTSVIGLGAPTGVVIDAGSAYKGLSLNGSGTTDLVSNLSLLHTRGTAIVASNWQGTLSNVIISDIASGSAVQNTSIFYSTNSSTTRSIILSGVTFSNILSSVQKFVWFRGVGTVLFTNCTLRGLTNSVAPGSGQGTFLFTKRDGDVSTSTGFSAVFADCTMDGLTVPGVVNGQAGVFMTGNGASLSLINCDIRNVSLTAPGTTLLSASYGTTFMRNSLLCNVDCGNYGAIGGMLSAASLRNCTFRNVSAVVSPTAGNTMTLYNSIVSDCTALNKQNPDDLYLKSVNLYNSGLGVGYSEANSTNVTAFDPWFVNAAAGDLHLRTLSPLVDVGNNVSAVGALDLDRTPRIQDGDADSTATVDLGAYEANFLAPVSARFQTALPVYTVNAGQTFNVSAWIQPPAAGPVTASVTYGTNMSGPATLTFPSGSETVTLSVAVSSPLTVPNGTLVPVSLSETSTARGVATGDVGFHLYSSVVTVNGYQSRAFLRNGTTNQYYVQMPEETLTAAENLTVTVGNVNGTGSNSVQWIGSQVITAGGWRTEGYLQVVAAGGENTITLTIDNGMSFSRSDSSNLTFAFVGYGSPLYLAPTGSDTTGLGTAASPLRSLTFALPRLGAGDEARLAAGLYSTNSGEAFPITVREGISVRGILGPNADQTDSSLIDADGTDYNFLLGTLAASDPGIVAGGGLYDLAMTDAKGTAIQASYWGGILSNCVIRGVINGGALDSTAVLRSDNNTRTTTVASVIVTNINSSASRLFYFTGGSVATLSKCRFQNVTLGATSTDGVFAFSDHLVTVTDCLFANLNWPGQNVTGRGFFRVSRTSRGSLTVERCIFHDLTATGASDAILSPYGLSSAAVRNSLFYNISTGTRAVAANYSCNFTVRNCTIDNASTVFSASSETQYMIVAYNSSVSFCTNLSAANGNRLQFGSVNVYNTPIGAGYDTGTSVRVTSFDPMYRDRANGNFRLYLGSPLLDGGTTNYVVGAFDLDLTNRIMGFSVDLGAYEAVPPQHGTVYSFR